MGGGSSLVYFELDADLILGDLDTRDVDLHGNEGELELCGRKRRSPLRRSTAVRWRSTATTSAPLPEGAVLVETTPDDKAARVIPSAKDESET